MGWEWEWREVTEGPGGGGSRTGQRAKLELWYCLSNRVIAGPLHCILYTMQIVYIVNCILCYIFQTLHYMLFSILHSIYSIYYINMLYTILYTILILCIHCILIILFYILYYHTVYIIYNSLYYIVICSLYYVLYFIIYISRWILLSQEEGLQLAETAFFSSGHFPRSVSGEEWQLRTPLLSAGIVSPEVLKGDMAAYQSIHYSFKMRKTGASLVAQWLRICLPM